MGVGCWSYRWTWWEVLLSALAAETLSQVCSSPLAMSTMLWPVQLGTNFTLSSLPHQILVFPHFHWLFYKERWSMWQSHGASWGEGSRVRIPFSLTPPHPPGQRMTRSEEVTDSLPLPSAGTGFRLPFSRTFLFLSLNFYDTVNSSKAKQCLKIPQRWITKPVHP